MIMKIKPCRHLLKIWLSSFGRKWTTGAGKRIAPANSLYNRWNKVYFIGSSSLVRWTLVYIQKLKGLSTTENVLTSHGIERALRPKTLQFWNAPIRTYELSTSALNLSIKCSYFSLPSPPDGGRHATKSSIWKTTSKHLTFLNILTKFPTDN